MDQLSKLLHPVRASQIFHLIVTLENHQHTSDEPCTCSALRSAEGAARSQNISYRISPIVNTSHSDPEHLSTLGGRTGGAVHTCVGRGRAWGHRGRASGGGKGGSADLRTGRDVVTHVRTGAGRVAGAAPWCCPLPARLARRGALVVLPQVVPLPPCAAPWCCPLVLPPGPGACIGGLGSTSGAATPQGGATATPQGGVTTGGSGAAPAAPPTQDIEGQQYVHMCVLTQAWVVQTQPE